MTSTQPINRERQVRAVAAAPLLLLALVPACAGHLPPCPAAGGPGWTELQSPHFRLRTDEPPAAGREMLTDLEQLQAALLFVFGAPADLDTGRLPVIVVDRGWTDFAAREIDGYFTHVLFQPLVVMAAASRAFEVDVVKHELVHHLSARVVPNQPPWFSEGVACYYQTVEYEPETGRLTVGRPAQDLLTRAQTVGAAAIERMFAATKIDREETANFYAAAWITIHYLMNHRADALAEYEKALRSGAAPEAAWTAAFGSQTAAQLAADVERYADGGQYEVRFYHLPAPAPETPVERPLTDADVHATRAVLHLTGRFTRALAPELSLGADDQKAAARRDVDEALRQEPDHVVAGAIAPFILNAPVDVAQARRASEKSPHDWLAWLLLADGLRQRGDQAGWTDAVVRARDAARPDPSVMFQVLIVERN
jgi:tetratricopeptide (TPR) repeat protein